MGCRGRGRVRWALPGTYQVRLTAAGRSYTQPLKVILDPRSTASSAELQKQFDLSMTIVRDMGRAADAMRQAAELRRKGVDAATEHEIARVIGASGGGRGGRGGGGGGTTVSSVNALLTTALGVAESADRTPPETAYRMARQASRELDALLTAWKALRAGAGEVP